jgi:short-subunit dehydrogenase
MTNPARPDSPAADPRHLLAIGAGPGLAGALAHRFAQGGYHLTLLARHTDGPAKLASGLADAGAAAGTVAADASDPGGLRATLTSLYAGTGTPGVLACNASMLTPGSLLNSDVARLHQAYDVDVAEAIAATLAAAPAMRAAAGGTIVFTGGGWA